MKFQALLNRKTQVISIKKIFLPIIIILVSISLTILSQAKFFSGSLKVLFESGFIMLGMVFF